MEENQTKTWFVTGSSRGLGRAIVERVLDHGDSVAAAARKPESLSDLQKRYGNRLLLVSMDVADQAQVKAGVAKAHEAFGKIDVVVNNAGYGFTGAFEEMTPAQFEAQIDTNFWGVVNVTRAVLPIMRKQGSGHILQISSVGGRQATPGLSAYQAAKFAVEGFSESVAQEIKPLGLHMTIVEPGGFNTDWAGSSMGFAEPMEAYAQTVGAFRTMIRSYAGHALGDPEKAADAILKVVSMQQPPLRLPLGSDAFYLLQATYGKYLEELNGMEDLTKSTDRSDLPPFDGPALLKMLGR